MSSRGCGVGVIGFLMLVAERVVFSIAELLWKELWALARIPFEIASAIFQAFAALDAIRTNLDIMSSVLSIYHNFSSGLSFPENFLQSLGPLGTLAWIGFWGAVFWYIGIPALGVVFSILTDHR